MNPAATLEQVFRREHGLVLSSLVRALGDFGLAEDALGDAMAAAVERWPLTGAPDNPAAWLVTVARRKAIDRIRRQRRLVEKLPLLAIEGSVGQETGEELDLPDERLRLIFTCCHPALSRESQVALTLRSLGGLSTAEIARALLTSEPTMFQRITRAKNKIRLARIPFSVPGPDQRGERTDSVLAVIYLIFNEGYSRVAGADLVGVDLCSEALSLADMLSELLSFEPEPAGLAALLWLTEGRRPARLNAAGDLVLLADQDRSSWNQDAMARGLEQLERARQLGHPGAYTLQAEIAAVHACAASHADTNWDVIVHLYEQLLVLQPSPVVALNHAAAVAMAAGPAAGLNLLEPLSDSLGGYQPYHAARSELLARTGRCGEAAEGFRRALGFSLNEVERRHLQKRLDEVTR